MDPRSIFLTLAVLSLLTGGVLGLMHRSLMPDVRPAAIHWRIGTLLLAWASVFFALRRDIPLVPSVIVGNLLAMSGTALYALSIRRFFGLPHVHWPAVLVAVGMGLLAWLAIVERVPQSRAVITSAIMAVHLLAAAWWVHQRRHDDLENAARMMTAILALAGALLALRALAAPFVEAPTAADPGWTNVIGGMAGAMFPVVGTTAFLMLAADRGRVRLQRAAVTDELTGLPNRRALTDAAHQGFATMAGGGQVGLILFDIDRFKSINDQHGHETGDRALAHVAAVMRAVVMPPAIAGRFGGEEFLCVLPGADAHQSVALAECLRVELVSRPLPLRQGTLAVTASFGVVVAGPDGETLEHALARADAAMYRAKSEGRNRVMLGAV